MSKEVTDNEVIVSATINWMEMSPVRNVTGNETFVSTEDDLKWLGFAELAVLILIGVIGTPGNGLIVLVQVKNQYKTSTDYLILTMAVIEFICSTLNVALHILRNLMLETVMTTAYCRTFNFTGTITATASSLLLAAISLDRFILTCRPLHNAYTIRKAQLICIGIPFTCIGLSSPNLFLYQVDGQYLCFHKNEWSKFVDLWNGFLGVIIFTVFAVILVAYTKVALLMRRRHKIRLKGHKKMESRPREATSATTDSTEVDLDELGDTSQIKNISNDVAKKIDEMKVKAGPKLINKRKETGERDGKGVVILDISYINLGETTTKQLYCQTSETYLDESAFQKDTFKHQNEDKNKCDDMMCKGDKDQVVGLKNVGARNCTELILREDSVCKSESSETFSLQKQEFAPGPLRKICPLPKRLIKEGQAINRTTKIMFLISVIYMTTWTVGFAGMLSGMAIGKILNKIGFTQVMINCISNPICFICMSSRFRANAKQVLCSLLKSN